MANQIRLDEVVPPDNACVNFGKKCTNVVPGNGKMCGDCLSYYRTKERENNATT